MRGRSARSASFQFCTDWDRNGNHRTAAAHVLPPVHGERAGLAPVRTYVLITLINLLHVSRRVRSRDEVALPGPPAGLVYAPKAEEAQDMAGWGGVVSRAKLFRPRTNKKSVLRD